MVFVFQGDGRITMINLYVTQKKTDVVLGLLEVSYDTFVVVSVNGWLMSWVSSTNYFLECEEERQEIINELISSETSKRFFDRLPWSLRARSTVIVATVVAWSFLIVVLGAATAAVVLIASFAVLLVMSIAATLRRAKNETESNENRRIYAWIFQYRFRKDFQC